MDYQYKQLILLFFIYSMAGWLIMTGIRSVQNRRPVNVGLLDGPICPSWGAFFTLCIWLAGEKRSPGWWQYFLCTVIGITVLAVDRRYARRRVGQAQSDILLRLFRACGRLDSLIMYLTIGLLGFCVTNMLQPFLLILINLFHPMVLLMLDLVLIGVFVIDLITSGIILQKLRNDQNRLQHDVTQGLDEARVTLARRFVMMLYSRIVHAYPEMSIPDGSDLDRTAEVEACLAENCLETKANSEQSDCHEEVLACKQKDLIIDSTAGISKSDQETGSYERTGKKKRAYIAEPARDRVFADGHGFMKIFWVFLICALVGDLIETVYCGVFDGKWMSRSSFLYGPLSLVWGGGAALGIVVLEPLSKKNDRWVFFGGFLLGGAYEYLCSVFTELVFGRVFWDYSHFPLNIGGRTNVLFMFFWGIVAVILLKVLYPMMSRVIEKIRPLPGLILTWALIILLSLDVLITGLALGRYNLRGEGQVSQNQIVQYLDDHYPDEVIEKRWRNMKKIK